MDESESILKLEGHYAPLFLVFARNSNRNSKLNLSSRLTKNTKCKKSKEPPKGFNASKERRVTLAGNL